MTDTILIVDDEKDIRQALGGLLGDEGYQVVQASSGPEALERLDESAPDLVILDLWMREAEEGFEVLSRIREDSPGLPVVIISGHGNIETAVRAVKLGAFDYIEKPLSADKLLLTVGRALRFQRLAVENQILKTRSGRAPVMTGRSPAMTELRRNLEIVAPTPASVLITGENGVGKELVARTIHELSHRSDRPMVEVNCAAIPEELVENELFGHEKGAFTGAAAKKRGRFDQAHNSTLFLDEIGDMSLKTQAKILRILQEQKFERVGGVNTIRVDVRIIAASNKNLEAEIERGLFRADLYYRLNVVTLRVPPLRERVSDIPLLAAEFLDAYSLANNLGPKTLARERLRELERRPWPGNVRELKNTIERLAIMTPGPVIGPAGEDRAAAAPGPAGEEDFLDRPFREARAEFERRYFRRQLARHGHNISQTAAAIRLDRTNLHKKLRTLGLKTGEEGGED